MKIKLFRLPDRSRDYREYALLAGRCGCALICSNGEEVWVQHTKNPMTDELALTLLQGIAFRSKAASVNGLLALYDNRTPDAESFLEIGGLLVLVGEIPGTSALAKACGTSKQRIYQLMSDETTMPSRSVTDSLRDWVKRRRSPYQGVLMDMLDSLASRAKSRLGARYERAAPEEDL